MLKNFLFVCLMILLFFISFKLGATSKDENIKLNVPIKKLFLEPDEKSKVVYDVPIDIVVTGKTNDSMWYKIKVSYNFLGYFEYEGWCKVD